MGLTDAERLISDLDAGFAAAIAAEEEAAAADLAFSLGQDVAVTEDLVRDGGSLLVSEVTAPIEWVGHDFVSAPPWLVPLDRAVVRLGGEQPALAADEVLVGLLRRVARSRLEVTVGGAWGSHRGRLARATPDHLVVRGAHSVAVPLAGIDYVRLAPGGSADAP